MPQPFLTISNILCRQWHLKTIVTQLSELMFGNEVSEGIGYERSGARSAERSSYLNKGQKSV